MKPLQYDIERHSPSRLADAYRKAADAAEHNPYLSERMRLVRARYYRVIAEDLEQRIKQ